MDRRQFMSITPAFGLVAAASEGAATSLFATVTALQSDTSLSLSPGDIIDAQGFRYQVAAREASDAHLVTAGGLKLYALVPPEGLDPRQLGAMADGKMDDAPYVERAWRICPHVRLAAGSSYLWKSVIGIPDQTVYGPNHFILSGHGATVIMDGASAGEEFLTSASAKLASSSQANIYTAKVDILGVNWVQISPSVIINGDRVYNVTFTGNSCSGITSVIKSFRPRLGNTQGYLQSVTLAQNQFSNVLKIVDAKSAFNFKWSDNQCEACSAGIYIDGHDDPAVTSFSMTGGAFEGGGMAVRLGRVFGATIRDVYLERNKEGDVATEKCEILIGHDTIGRSGSVLVEACTFLVYKSQAADEDYAIIKERYSSTNPNIGPLEVKNCYTTGPRLWGRDMVPVQSGNTIAPARKNGRLLSPAPMSPATASRSYAAAVQRRSVADNNDNGVFSVAEITVQDAIDYGSRGAGHRDACGTIHIRMAMLTGMGGVECGAALAVIDFIAMGSSNGVHDSQSPVDDCYMAFVLRTFVQVEASLAIEDQFRSTTKEFFTSPTLTADRVGSSYVLKLTGYKNQAIPNWGEATVMISSVSLDTSSISPYGGRGSSVSFISARAD